MRENKMCISKITSKPKGFLINKYVSYNKENPSLLEDILLISIAYDFSEKAHEGQKRLSGQKYFVHPLAVANILVALKKDAKTIAAGLLHDVVEDTNCSILELEKYFGRDVSVMVKALTCSKKKSSIIKMNGLELKTDALLQIDECPLYKNDVVAIKLADRLNNMRDISYLPAERQKRYAVDSLVFLKYFGSSLNREEYIPLCNEIRHIAFDKIPADLVSRLNYDIKNNVLDAVENYDSYIKKQEGGSLYEE